MPQLDIRSDLLSNVALTTVVSGNGATGGAIIDTFNYDLGLMLQFVAPGVFTDGTYVFSIEEGDDPGLADASAVTDSQIIGDLTAISPTAAAVNGDKLQTIGLFGTKRYIRVILTASAVTSGAAILVLAVQKSADMPVDNADES